MKRRKSRQQYYVCKFSKNFQNIKLYYIEKSNTRGQTLQIQMRWLSMSRLIWIYSVCKIIYCCVWRFAGFLTIGILEAHHQCPLLEFNIKFTKKLRDPFDLEVPSKSLIFRTFCHEKAGNWLNGSTL